MRTIKALKNAITSIILQIVTFICGLIVPRLILENFGSDVNGLINSITQFLAYITLLESGFGPVVKSILYKPIAKKDKNQIELILKSAEHFFRLIALIFIIYIAILCLVYPMFVNSQFDSMYTVSLILIIAISTFAEYFFGMTYKLYLQAEQKSYVTSTIQISTLIINTILIVLLINFGASIQIVKLGSALIFIFRPILQNIYVKKKYNINLKNVEKGYNIKQKWDGLAQHIAGVVHGNTDVTILTIFSTMKEVSVYTVYNLVVTGIRNLVTILSNSIDAAFGDMIAKKEKENLNKKFSMYELVYYTLITIIYSCAIVLIVPFVQVYTKGITDVNYTRKIFAYIFVIAYFIHAIKTPYNTLAYAAGKFKQTQIGAWVEAISNLVISLILVHSLGLVGVAIGTLISVTIRGVEFLIFSSKNILDRKISKTFIRSIISIVELLIIMIVGEIIIDFNDISYLNWIVQGIRIFLISIIIVIPINLIYYKEERKELVNLMKKLVEKGD